VSNIACSSFVARDPTRVAGFAGGVADVQDHVADRGVVERWQLRGQRQAPGADRPRPLEREEPRVVQAGFEHPAVIHPRAGDDHVGRAEVVDEALVVLVRDPSVAAVGEQR
jgi:hypothetical protein